MDERKDNFRMNQFDKDAYREQREASGQPAGTPSQPDATPQPAETLSYQEVTAPRQGETASYQEATAQQPQQAEPAPSVYAEMELPEIPASPQPPTSLPVSLYDPPKFEPQGSKERKGGWRLFVAAVALVTLSTAVGSGSTYYLMTKNRQSNLPIGYIQPQSNSALPVAAKTTAEAGASVIPAIYEQVAPSVVAISVTSGQGFSRAQGSGSGFVVDARGYILTNHHVIDKADRVSVKFVDGTVLPAKVVGKDKSKDLAVIQVDPGERSLVPITLGDSDAVQVGELAIAIGNPFGHEFTVTSGIVSALNREITEEAAVSIPGAIQTDAAINPGNSGGPLLNSRGEVIGINTAIDATPNIRANVGLGFAVPVNLAKEILPDLIAGKTVQRPFLGVSFTDMDSRVARLLGTDVTEGAVVMEVQPGSAAEKAGFRDAVLDRYDLPESADVITAVNGTKISNGSDLVQALMKQKVGDTISITVYRGKEKVTLSATLGGRADD